MKRAHATRRVQRRDTRNLPPDIMGKTLHRNERLRQEICKGVFGLVSAFATGNSVSLYPDSNEWIRHYSSRFAIVRDDVLADKGNQMTDEGCNHFRV